MEYIISTLVLVLVVVVLIFFSYSRQLINYLLRACFPIGLMAAPLLLLVFIFLLSPVCLAHFHVHHPPNALVLPISKHASTLQYTTQIHQRTPLVPIKIVLDLSGQFLWVSGNESNYNSSSYAPTTCHSPQCSTARSISTHGDKIPSTDCVNDREVCSLKLTNTFSGMSSDGELSRDLLSIPSTDGLNPRSNVTTEFLFSSAPWNLSRGLAADSLGIGGLGQSVLALPKQLSHRFNVTKKFAICLPPSTESDGVVFFGDGPYAMFPGIDVSKLLTYTPLVKHLDEYYLATITSIQVNSKSVSIDPASPLVYDRKSRSGGTKFSTRNPYTIMKSSVYKAFADLFIQEAEATANVTRVAEGTPAEPPFDVCFSRKASEDHGVAYTPAMPTIDLVLQAEEVFWRVFETNSLVEVGGGVVCLGFLDGGDDMKESVVIGGHQLEDNMLQFDLELSRLGFTSTLLFRETSCSNFNFTPHTV